jgi:LysR family nitrogen assimilation transcriptional regulator
MDLRQLRYFIAIAEQGSFSRAANLLHIAQPALSLHVRNMEFDLGTPLLSRSPKGVVPTEAGEILLRNARIILDQFTIAEEEIRGHDNDPSGEVRLGLPGTISQILAVPLITAARTRYPKIKLRIAEAMSGFVLEWMRDSRIDLAVLYGNVSDKGISMVRILQEELVFFGPPEPITDVSLPENGEELSYNTIAQLPLILPSEG